jgi:SH3 domain-containing YSC84-like protein 1
VEALTEVWALGGVPVHLKRNADFEARELYYSLQAKVKWKVWKNDSVHFRFSNPIHEVTTTSLSDTIQERYYADQHRKDVREVVYMSSIRVACALSIIAFFCLSVVMTPAQKSSRTRDAARHSGKAAETFTEIMNVKDKAIPKELLDTAEAIAVFPGVIKAAFIVGGRGGQGVISRRVKGGWSAPAFFNLGGGSFGPQIGAQRTDYVLLIMNPSGLEGLLKDKFELGGEAGIAAGPVGREAAASTNPRLDAGILSYSRSKGAFIGAALKGAVISPDNDLNEAIYGKKADAILTGASMTFAQMPASVRIFPRTLVRYSIK